MNGMQAESFVVPEATAFASLNKKINSDIDRKVQSHGQGDHQKDWHWNAKMSHSANTLYVPICHAIFDYQGTKYHFWIDGIGESEIRADKLPEDKDRKNLVNLGFIPAGVAIVGLIAASLIWGFHWGGLVVATILGGYAAIRRKSIIGYSQKIRESLLTQIHASSNTTRDAGGEVRDKVAQSIQRPEKPFFAKTHKDKIAIPVLSLVALLGVSTSSYFANPNHYMSHQSQAEVTTVPTQNSPSVMVGEKIAGITPAPHPTTTSSNSNILSDAVFIQATSDAQGKVLARGDINGDGYEDAIVQEMNCGASCGINLAVVLNDHNSKVTLFNPTKYANFEPAYSGSGAAKSELTNVSINDEIISLTGRGLECENDCDEKKWNTIRTVKYKFDGKSIVKIN
jgi:hypothetical protein